jgi:hypothetical protein
MNGNDAFRLKLWLRGEPKALNEIMEVEKKGNEELVEKKIESENKNIIETPAATG